MNASRCSNRVLVGLFMWCIAAAAMAQPLGAEDARFFLTRTGFAPPSSEVAIYQRLTRQQAVDRVLSQATSSAVTPAPAWAEQPIVPYKILKDKSEEEKKAFRDTEQKQAFELRGWWLREMLATTSPLTERMTLFWHNHFVSSQQKVKYSQLMYRQNRLFRQQALGRF